MKSLQKKIGTKVNELRKLKGLTQEALAEKIGTSIETVSRLERGVNLPSVITLSQIADVLGFDLKELFGFKESIEVSKKEKLIDELVLLLKTKSYKDIEMAYDVLKIILKD